MRSGVRMVLVVGAIVLGLRRPPPPTAPVSARRPSSRSATPRSPARAGAGRGTRTSRPRAPTRSARAPTGTRPRARRSPAATAQRRRSTRSAAAWRASTSPARARRRPPAAPAPGKTSSPASTSTPTARPQGPGAGAAELREDAQRPRGRPDDRREQLRLRGHRRALRDQLGDLAVVVQELLQRRLDMTSRFTAARQATETTNVSEAFKRVAQAMTQRRLQRDAVHDHRPDVLVADPARQRLPLPGERLDAPVDRRLRHLEPRRRLGEQHGRARDEQQRQERRGRRGAALPPTSSRSTLSSRSSAGGCASPASGCWRRPAPRAGRARARSTAASGSRRSGR